MLWLKIRRSRESDRESSSRRSQRGRWGWIMQSLERHFGLYPEDTTYHEVLHSSALRSSIVDHRLGSKFSLTSSHSLISCITASRGLLSPSFNTKLFSIISPTILNCDHLFMCQFPHLHDEFLAAYLSFVSISSTD